MEEEVEVEATLVIKEARSEYEPFPFILLRGGDVYFGFVGVVYAQEAQDERTMFRV